MRRLCAVLVAVAGLFALACGSAGAATIRVGVPAGCTIVGAIDDVSDAADHMSRAGTPAAACPPASPVVNTILLGPGKFSALGDVPTSFDPNALPLQSQSAYGPMELTIRGAGEGRTELESGGAVALGVTARISDLTMSGPTQLGAVVGGRYGTALINAGVMYLTDVAITDDSTGTAVFNSGRLTMTGTAITDNTAEAGSDAQVVDPVYAGTATPGEDGGGVYNDAGTVTLSDSLIADNSAGAGGNGVATSVPADAGSPLDGAAGGTGGGIYSWEGSLTVTNTTLTGNSAGSGGQAAGASASTPAGVDGATGTGAAIESLGTNLRLVNDTIADNGVGGAIDASISSNGGSVGLAGTLIADNAGGNCGSTSDWVDLGHNLDFGDNSCPSSFLRGSPRLLTLANNGGPVETMALGAGSAAVLHSARAGCPATDARGALRRSGCDVGAFERAAPTILKSEVTTAGARSAQATIHVAANAKTATLTLTYWQPGAGVSRRVLAVPGVGVRTVTVVLRSLAASQSYRYRLAARSTVGVAAIVGEFRS